MVFQKHIFQASYFLSYNVGRIEPPHCFRLRNGLLIEERTAKGGIDASPKIPKAFDCYFRKENRSEGVIHTTLRLPKTVEYFLREQRTARGMIDGPQGILVHLIVS